MPVKEKHSALQIKVLGFRQDKKMQTGNHNSPEGCRIQDMHQLNVIQYREKNLVVQLLVLQLVQVASRWCPAPLLGQSIYDAAA